MSGQAFSPIAPSKFSMRSIESSMIAEIGYYSDFCMMQIRFKPRAGDLVGPLYQYMNVTVDTWEELFFADSIGKAFTRLIKNKPQYPCVQVVESQPA